MKAIRENLQVQQQQKKIKAPLNIKPMCNMLNFLIG